ncbi:MAG: TetR/AcrR family transcriptional regulator [Veillonellaceae bacterium]|jgi:AcrR family transcriptional regulator|nr:TetR/AcrR family transcriptional regulator [Veillonellaceae bacterium]
MEHDSVNLSPKEKILDATMKIIGTKGYQHVTSRKIAALAHVNVASINYYFGSKDTVVNEALKAFNAKLMSSFNYLDDLELPPETRLQKFLRTYADYTLEYPDIFRNFVDQVSHESEAPCEYIEFMKETGLNKLKVLVHELTGNQLSETELVMRIFQLFSSLEYPVLVGDKMNNIAHFDYYDQECRYRYIDLALKALIK